MSLLMKMIGYTYLFLAVCSYLGLESNTIMPPALVSIDAKFGGYVKSNLDFFNNVGEAHFGEIKAKFL